MLKRFRFLKGIIMAIVLAVVLIAIPLPYYITTPGSAQDLTPFVEVENGDNAEGELMLVTVSMGRANILGYLLAHFHSYSHIFTKREILGDQNSEAYNFQQLQMMQNAQSDAIEVAYKRAGKEVETVHKGIVVLGVDESMPAANILAVGDIITGIDGKEMLTADEFIAYVKEKKAGDSVEVTFTREKEELTKQITLETLESDKSRVGLGVQIQTVSEQKTNPTIEINTNSIGGPSAGMMFTLEIYNQLTEGDLTRGHRIAGTGTISADGQVGPIGGIDQKVVAADNAGAEIFFAPTFEIDGGSNYEIAVKVAKDIGTDMRIVPVDTIDDAFAYLQNLKEK